MSWKHKTKLRAILDEEEGTVIKDWGGKTSIALVYPNTYRVGMGNLAIHSLYRMLNERRDIVCERAFLPEKTLSRKQGGSHIPVLSLESQRPLAEFDCVAFSVSFENDYLNILPILDLANIPHRKHERTDDHPLLIAGGAAPTLNPAPLSEIFDAIVTGEAECYAFDLFPTLSSGLSKSESLSEIAKLTKTPRHLKNLDGWPTETVIHTRNAEFGDMHLIEISRGCPYHCRFCATPVIYGKPRERSFEAVIKMVENGLKHRRRFGLIGAHILSHPDFTRIAKAILARGASFSPSSIRVDEINEVSTSLLAKSGVRSVALGIEAGSEQLRKAAGKDIPDERIVETARMLASFGITNLRLYFIIGLPGENAGDIESIVRLSRRVKKEVELAAPRARRQITVAIKASPFVPKPGTPFSSAPFAGEKELKRKITALKRLLARDRFIGLDFDPPLSAAVEAKIASGGSNLIEFFEKIHHGCSIRNALIHNVITPPTPSYLKRG